MKTKVLLLLLCLFNGPVNADQWQDQPADSQLYFAPSFEWLPINGEFRQFVVNMVSDQNLQPEALSVKVQITSADLGSSDLNEAIQMVDWFDSQSFAEASFTSEQIVATEGDNQFIARGRLSLKSANKTIQVPFSWLPSADGSIKMLGELQLDRGDFAIGSGEWSSGDQIGLAVRVWFDINLVSAGD